MCIGSVDTFEAVAFEHTENLEFAAADTRELVADTEVLVASKGLDHNNQAELAVEFALVVPLDLPDYYLVG